MEKGELPTCAACGDEIAELASKLTVRGVPGHFHAGCAVQTRMIRNLYRAGHIAGLREAAECEWRPIETAPKDGTQIMLSGITPGTTNRWQGVGAWWRDDWRDDEESGPDQRVAFLASTGPTVRHAKLICAAPKIRDVGQQLLEALERYGFPVSLEAWANAGPDAPASARMSVEAQNLHRAAVTFQRALSQASEQRNDDR